MGVALEGARGVLEMKICLLRLPCVTLPYPPDIGLGHVDAAIKAAGYDVKVVDLNWDLFRTSPSHVKEHCLDHGMIPDVITELRRAGCCAVNFGLESASQPVLDAMGKKFKIGDAERIFKDLKTAGIGTCVNFIVGFPGETEEYFQDTLDFLARNAPYIDAVGSMASMWINSYAPVYNERDRFGVVVTPKEGTHWYTDWHTKDGANTAAIREDRRERFVRLAIDLGLYLSSIKQKVPLNNG